MAKTAERDWREDLADILVQTMRGEGFTFYNQDLIEQFLDLMIKRDSRRKPSRRAGFLDLAQYAASGRNKFLKFVHSSWNQKVERQMSIQTVLPPGSAHSLQTVISLKLDKDNYDVQKLHEILKTYMIEAISSPFDCLVIQVCKVFGCWYDVKLQYSCNLIDAYKVLTSIPWVKDGIARPASDFGVKTLALPEN